MERDVNGWRWSGMLRNSTRSPERMVGEQSVDKANFVNNEKTERHADQAGSDTQSSIETRESFIRIGKRENHRSGDEHHACNCADPENEQVNNCPFRIANRRQHQKSDSGRARETVHKSDNKRTHDLINAEPAEMTIEPAQRCLL